MARIRTVKPEFWTSEQVVECSPIARLLFIGMWNFCDDGGVHPVSVKRLKMEIFPGDTFSFSDIENMIEELILTNLLIAFSKKDQQFWYVTGWHHQKIDRPTYRYPGPHNPDDFVELSTSPRRVLDESSPPEGSLREGSLRESKGRERVSSNAPAHARASSFPTDFQLTDGRRAYADSKKVPDPDRAFERFCDHHQAKGSTFKDWDAAWRTWCQREQDFTRPSSGNGSRQPSKLQRAETALREKYAKRNTGTDDRSESVQDARPATRQLTRDR